MSNEWSGDGGFSKGDDQTKEYYDRMERERHRGYEPQNEWNVGEPPTEDWQRPDWVETGPQHRAEGGDNCGMGWASNPWKLLGNLIAWAGIILVLFCIVAFIAGGVMGAFGALS